MALTRIDLSTLASSEGFFIWGVNRSDQLGVRLAGVGDVNGDGVDDYIIGAHLFDLTVNGNQGAAFLIYGDTNGFAGGVNLAATGLNGIVDGGKGLRLTGAVSVAEIGIDVDGIGDVNGDGIDDFAIGARKAFSNAGATYVVYGGQNLSTIDVSTMTTSQGYTITGANAGDFSGRAFDGIGDVNGDGLDDFIIGASGGDASGQSDTGIAYVVYGAATRSSFNLANLAPQDGFRLTGDGSNARLGSDVSAIGDFNGDGIDDMLLGAPQVQGNFGYSYIIYGTTNATRSDISMSAIRSGNDASGFAISGVTGGRIGNAVAGIGDFNGDGLEDVIIGEALYDTSGTTVDAGRVGILFGQAGLEGASARSLLAWGLFGNNLTGFILTGDGANDRFGIHVAGVGDFNGDGFDDLLIGSPNLNGAHLVFGAATGWEDLNT
ncbi:MAG: integrin alpha, partial [Pseudomonadota bacterium]